MNDGLRRGSVVWVELDPVRGREQAGRRPALVIASDAYLRQADTLAIILPGTTTDRGWPNHIRVRGSATGLTEPTFVMTEQPRTITRERIIEIAGMADTATMREVDSWLQDFLDLGDC